MTDCRKFRGRIWDQVASGNMRRIFRDYPFFNLQTRSNYEIRESAAHPDRLWTFSSRLWRNPICKPVRISDLLAVWAGSISRQKRCSTFVFHIANRVSIRYTCPVPCRHPIWVAGGGFLSTDLCASLTPDLTRPDFMQTQRGLTRQKEAISLGQGRPTSHIVHQNRRADKVNVVCEIADTDCGFCFVPPLSHNNTCSWEDLAATRLNIHFETSTQHYLQHCFFPDPDSKWTQNL